MCVLIALWQAQGYECDVVDGMRALLGARAVVALRTEVSKAHLRRHGCTDKLLTRRIVEGGFHVTSDALGSVQRTTKALPAPSGSARKNATRTPLSLHKLRLLMTKGMYDIEAWQKEARL